MRALIVQEPWAELIVYGKKKWELRKRACHIRERVGIVQAGTRSIIGEANLVDCIDINDRRIGDINRWYELHRVPKNQMENYTINYAWCFDDAMIYDSPQKYVHRQGSQIWIKDPFIFQSGYRESLRLRKPK